MTNHDTRRIDTEHRRAACRFLSSAVAAAALLLAAAGAAAQQRTLDPELQKEIFSNIDARLQSLEQTRATAVPTLERLASSIADHKARLGDLGPRDPLRIALTAEITHLTAKFVQEGRRLLNAAIKAVGGNLHDLDRLSRGLRAAAESASSETLRHTIERNVATGRAMQRALIELARWSGDDPELKRNFDGLQRVLRTLDSRITTDRRIADAAGDASAPGRHVRYVDYLDNAIDELADIHMRLEAERQRLDDLRDEVLVATQFGELEMTRVIAERALPGLGSNSAVTAELPNLTAVLDTVTDLNAHSLMPETAEGSEPGAPSSPPVIPEFRNF